MTHEFEVCTCKVVHECFRRDDKIEVMIRIVTKA